MEFNMIGIGQYISNGFTKVLLVCSVVSAFVILALCGWINHQSATIDGLNGKIKTHQETIAAQSQTITRLEEDAERNRQLTFELSQVESDARSKSDAVIKSIPKQVKASSAFNTSVPSNVIEFLRQ